MAVLSDETFFSAVNYSRFFNFLAVNCRGTISYFTCVSQPYDMLNINFHIFLDKPVNKNLFKIKFAPFLRRIVIDGSHNKRAVTHSKCFQPLDISYSPFFFYVNVPFHTELHVHYFSPPNEMICETNQNNITLVSSQLTTPLHSRSRR